MFTYFKKLGDQFGAVRTQIRNERKLTAPPQNLPGGHRQWIVDSTHWLVSEFGGEVLDRPIVLPEQLIPAGYDGTEVAARSIFAELCRRMDVRVDQVELRFDLLDDPVVVGSPTLAGGWAPGKDRSIIGVRPDVVRDPATLVAVLAHELGHELLIGSGRVKASRPDHEPLTDLLTIFYWLGIFVGLSARNGMPSGQDARLRRLETIYVQPRACGLRVPFLHGARWWRRQHDQPARHRPADRTRDGIRVLTLVAEQCRPCPGRIEGSP